MQTSVPFVGSSLSTRLVETYKAAGRPLPKFSKDDVLDYLVMEAVVAKHAKDQNNARERAEYERKRQEFKEDKGIEQRIAEAR